MAGLDDAAARLESIAANLRLLADGELQRELAAAMRDAVKPVPDEIRADLGERWKRGGYGATLDTDLNLGTSVRNAAGGPAADPSASVYGRTRSGRSRKLRRLDTGELTHPLFGDREHWYKQPAAPPWFTGPAEAAAPRVRAALERARDDISAKATGK